MGIIWGKGTVAGSICWEQYDLYLVLGNFGYHYMEVKIEMYCGCFNYFPEHSIYHGLHYMLSKVYLAVVLVRDTSTASRFMEKSTFPAGCGPVQFRLKHVLFFNDFLDMG